MFAGPGSVLPHVNARRLKALAVTSPKRAVGLENVPTFIESGYPAVDATQWFGVVTPTGTPKSIVDKVNREIVRVLQQPEVQERFLANGANVRSSTPQEFAQLIRNDLAKWQKVVKASGVRPQ
jgi:tripartite-type tricarboxylate transporter receptor subunit TctC